MLIRNFLIDRLRVVFLRETENAIRLGIKPRFGDLA